MPSCVIGCKVGGNLKTVSGLCDNCAAHDNTHESMIFSATDGSSLLSASLRESVRVCSGLGTCPVSNSQSMLSGIISFPPGEDGSNCRQS